MGSKPLHLGWFMNFTPGEWDHPLSVGGSPWDGRFYVDMAQALERACFDYIMIEDTLMVSEAYGDSAEAALKHALQVPKHDPSPLAAIISAATRRLGVVATFSTLEYPPWMLARLCCTLDHIAGGRFGWNIVTSGEDAAAQNFGIDKLPPREQRYAMADEYVDLVCRLFDSWDPDAVVMDRETGTYADFRKVRHDRLRRKILQGARAAEHGALAARAAGIRAGGRVTAWAGVRRAACGFDHRHRQRHRGHEGISR